MRTSILLLSTDEMDEAELSAVRDFVDPSVFQWLFSDGSLESEVSEAPNPGKFGGRC